MGMERAFVDRQLFVSPCTVDVIAPVPASLHKIRKCPGTGCFLMKVRPLPFPQLREDGDLRSIGFEGTAMGSRLCSA